MNRHLGSAPYGVRNLRRIPESILTRFLWTHQQESKRVSQKFYKSVQYVNLPETADSSQNLFGELWILTLFVMNFYPCHVVLKIRFYSIWWIGWPLGEAGSVAVLPSLCTNASWVRYPVPVLYVQLVFSPKLAATGVSPGALVFLLHFKLEWKLSGPQWK